ncbi:MAG: multicopper oxidase family protein [Candidatus Tectomicrobia bacterium]|uniref:Multicopper oxidase family protein n=1 Tax=Tectimicrobiota bacterium TaxID=2528274 RepID=A0A932M2B3_UNCTE|nr:multicopper oxidase family protein [Candidatus Tectomicrobia bacterium]
MGTTEVNGPPLTRREFLRVSGQAGLGAVTLTVAGGAFLPGPSGAQRRGSAAIREIHIETREVNWELAPGKRIKAMAYNGQIPGPELRLKEGERVRISLKNSLSEPTTIHWHGVDVPNSMDGVPGITQKPVQPGETFIYEFEARPAGTRWYHTHFQGHRQLDLGLYAPLIIEPGEPDPFPFDREYTLVMDDWATGTGTTVARTTEGTAGSRAGMGGMMGMMRGMMGGSMGRMMEGMMGRGGMGTMMGDGQRSAYDTMTINGKAYPATKSLKVRKGERVRLRLINASADHTHVIRLAGHRLQVTHTDGNPLVQPLEVDAVPIVPSERYDVLFAADRPGAWFLYCVEPGHAAAGEQVLVVYEGREDAKPEAPVEGMAGLDLWHYSLGRSRDILPAASGQERAYYLVLSGGMMGSDVWTINGKQYPRTDPLRLRKGDLARVRFENHSMEAHPMHLHGQSFKILEVNGQRLVAPIAKDSVDVEAHMGSVDIEFTAHNPGDWFFHCHKPMHMEGGMITLAKIT